MRNLILVAQFFFLGVAFSQELPNSILITELPKNLALIVKKDIVVKASSYDGTGWFSYKYRYSSKPDMYDGFYIHCKKPHIFNGSPDYFTLLIVKSVRPYTLPIHHEGGGFAYNLNDITFKFVTDEVDEGEGCELQISFLDKPMAQTIDELKPYLNGMIGFVDSDPYGHLDPETASKIIMKKISSSIENEKYSESLLSFFMLERRGANLPEEFYFYYAKALERVGNKRRSMMYATKYLSKYGKNGKYYEKIVELIALL